MKERVTVLGATGSIGVSTLDIIARHHDRFEVYALTGFNQVELLAKQCLAFQPNYAVVPDSERAETLRALLVKRECETEVLAGVDALEQVASAQEVDTVVAAIVGAAGLTPTMAAVSAGKKVLLANKESLVMAGRLFMEAVDEFNATLLPVDSEHNAIFQCLPAGFKSLSEAGVDRILLTGSGGPFRKHSREQLLAVTPEQACAHPNWSMGKKISVDSATMMNKGLEFIEACWLFHAKPSQIEVVVHPQSIIHSMVEYADGSVLSQMGMPDMRTPIANCLSWPARIEAGVERVNFATLGALEFSAPDFERFPCLKIAIDAISAGGTLPAAVNAANEVAVAAFLDREIPFLGIADVVSQVATEWRYGEPTSLSDVIAADQEARQIAASAVAQVKRAG